VLLLLLLLPVDNDNETPVLLPLLLEEAATPVLLPLLPLLLVEEEGNAVLLLLAVTHAPALMVKEKRLPDCGLVPLKVSMTRPSTRAPGANRTIVELPVPASPSAEMLATAGTSIHIVATLPRPGLSAQLTEN